VVLEAVLSLKLSQLIYTCFDFLPLFKDIVLNSLCSAKIFISVYYTSAASDH